MAADLQAVPALAQVVGVVNRPAGQPENAFLDPPQKRYILAANGETGVVHVHSLRLEGLKLPASTSF